MDWDKNLEKCLNISLNLSIWPRKIVQMFEIIARSLSVPTTILLLGFLTVTQFAIGESYVQIEDTEWIEPLIVWIILHMPSGSRKSNVHRFLSKLIHHIDR